MKKNTIDINKYDVYVFDVDGTLYYQNRLRFEMAKRLLFFVLKNPIKILDLRLIQKFRNLRENSNTTDGIYELIADKYKKNKEYVKDFIDFWIYDNPLSAIKKTRDLEIINLIERLCQNNKKVVIWSDYKAVDKLKAIGLTINDVYTADDERVRELKPSPKALELIKMDFLVPNDKILMIGDRDSKDGEAARRASIDYIILPKDARGRKKCYAL